MDPVCMTARQQLGQGSVEFMGALLAMVIVVAVVVGAVPEIGDAINRATDSTVRMILR